MSSLLLDQADGRPAAPEPAPRRRRPSLRSRPRRTRTRRAAPPTRRTAPVAAASLTLLALAVGAFVLHAAVLGAVEHARSQRVAYAQLRAELSAVTAPLGQTDAEGRPLALGTPLGYLTVPGLDLAREVFFEGTTAAVLAKGPGHRRSSVLPGQAGVAILYGRAWAYGGPFGRAGALPVGSPVIVTTQQGEHRYRVTGTRRDGDRIPAPDPRAAPGRLTLVTAVGPPFAPSGVVYVDATLVTPAVPAGPLVVRSADLLPAEAALASDPSAWPVVFLLLQALALSALAMAWGTRRWGASQAWLVGVPVLGLLTLLSSREIMRLLPNLL